MKVEVSYITMLLHVLAACEQLAYIMHVINVCLQIVQYYFVHDVCVHIKIVNIIHTPCFCKNCLQKLHDVCVQNFLEILTIYQNNTCTWRLCSDWPSSCMLMTFVYKSPNIMHVHDIRMWPSFSIHEHDICDGLVQYNTRCLYVACVQIVQHDTCTWRLWLGCLI